MNYTFELNNERKDKEFASGNLKSNSPVIEVFSAMIEGRELPKFKEGVADKCVKYIEGLAHKASCNDFAAISELNELRRFVMQPVVLRELKLLSIYGNYKPIGFNDSCEIEITDYIGKGAEIQALGQDVKFPTYRKKRVPIATTTISGGYAVDYRKAALGDMTDENALQERVRVQIRNLATKYVIDTVYDAIKNATGIKYMFEGNGLTKTGVDDILRKVRPFGKPTISGDYALLSQFNGFAGYEGVTPAVTGISEAIMKEIHDTGLMGVYNGATLSEIPNEYDLSILNAAGDNFATILDQGLGFVIPAGTASPIHTITRGGLTSVSGTDVTTGQLMTRFDLEIGALVTPGREYSIGLLRDTSISPLN